jgi:hypothetical protein
MQCNEPTPVPPKSKTYWGGGGGTKNRLPKTPAPRSGTEKIMFFSPLQGHTSWQQQQLSSPETTHTTWIIQVYIFFRLNTIPKKTYFFLYLAINFFFTLKTCCKDTLRPFKSYSLCSIREKSVPTPFFSKLGSGPGYKAGSGTPNFFRSHKTNN